MAGQVPRSSAPDSRTGLSPDLRRLLPRPPPTPPASPASRSSPSSRRIIRVGKYECQHEICEPLPDNIAFRTPSPASIRYTPDDLRIQIPDDTDTSDEEIHRLTCRKSFDCRNSDTSSEPSSDDELSPEDAVKLSELEKVREESHREVEMFLLRAQTSSRPDDLSPDLSQSGDEMWSSQISMECNEKKLLETDSHSVDQPLLPEPAGQNEEYFHRVVPFSLPFRENLKHGKRYRRYKSKANSSSNRLSESLKRYAQYQNIWADIYDEQNMEDVSAMAEFDPNGPYGYIAPLVCPIPGEDSEEEETGNNESASSFEVNPIIEAVLNQNLKTLKECLEKGQGDVNAPIDEGGWTALHFAVRLSTVELCSVLLSNGASLTSRDAVEHWTPLHVAAMTYDISAEVLKLLLEHVQTNGLDACTKDVHGRTALHLCLLSACKKLAEKELNDLLDQKLMDDFHYFLLRAGDSSVWNTIPKRKVQDAEEPFSENADVTFPVSDSQHTLTGILQDPMKPKDEDQFSQTCEDDMPSSQMADLNNTSTSTSDSNTSKNRLNYDPDQSSEALDSDDREQSVPQSLPLELLNDADSAEEPPVQISLPLCSIPEERSIEMTARYVTTTMTFHQDKDIDYNKYNNRECFEYQSDDSSIEDCIAILETFDLSSDDERIIHKQQIDQTQLLIIYEKIRLLLDYGFQLNAKDNKGDSILHYVAWIDNLDIFKYVIDYGTDSDLNKMKNYEGQTVLHMANLSGCPGIIKFLLERGVDPNVVDHYGNTPLDMFIMEHIRKKCHMITPWLRNKEIQTKYSTEVCLEVLQLFSDHSCVVSNIATMDHLLTNMSLDRLEDLVRKTPKLLDFSVRNFQRQTLLHVASLRKYDEDQVGLISLIVGFLIDNGVNVNEKDVNGRTALHLACWQRNKAMIETLLIRGADTRLCDKFGQSCLHYTVMELPQILPNWSSFSAFQAALFCLADPSHPQKLIEYQLGILELLLANKADINHADCHGRTALHRAITDADKTIVAYIVSQGADLNVADRNGLSPSVYIVKLHRNELFHLIFSAGKTNKPAYEKCKDLPPFRRPIIPAIEEQPENCEFDSLEHIRRMRGDIDKFTKKLLTTAGIGHVVFEGENANIRGKVFLLMQRLSSALGDVDQRLASSVHIAGSVREDTKVGQANGFDYIFELINLKDLFEIDNPSHHSNFVSLRMKENIAEDSNVAALCDSQGILRGSMLASVFGLSVLQVLSKSSIWNDLEFIWEDDMELGSNFVTFPCVIQLRWMGPKYRDLLININIVPAICVPSAGEGKMELSDLTTTKSMNTLCPGNCTVLIKWQGDLVNDCNLQLSFFDAEGQVFHNISSIIKDGYRLAKIVSTTGLCQQEGSGINAFLLKTVLFWLLYPQGNINDEPDFSWICPIGEKLPVSLSSQKWTEIRWVAYHLFDRLESHLFTEYLASFFVPAENVLSFTSNSLDKMIDMCMAAKAVLSDPD